MNEFFLKRANENIPEMYEKTVEPVGNVKIVENKNTFFGFEAVADNNKEIFQNGDSTVLDFGEHCVGRLSFNMSRVDKYLDAPVKIKLRFAEIPLELSRDFSDYKGWICASWLQEETVCVDFAGEVNLDRRYCFRYVEVTVLNTPRAVRINNFKATHTTSASRKTDLYPKEKDELLHKIDCVGAKTLEDCMQEVYEDGPKRDRRLWIGDFRLQALTDYSLFKNYKLVRRCLYLFAACAEEGKYLPGCLYHKPELYFDGDMEIMDYALLYTVALCEYYDNTEDKETVEELFDVARSQIELALSGLDENGIVTFPPSGVFEGGFIDWAENLKIKSAVHGVFLYALKKMADLANALGKTDCADRWQTKLVKARKNAYDALYDSEKEIFCNKYDDFQYSVHAQVWLILGEVVTGEKAKNLLKSALRNADVKPVTPYMHHYVLEAMCMLGMEDEALKYIKNYWGGMVENGADTFWEVYVPSNNKLSAYDDKIIESYCHAWSCTPSYFIRKYFCD